MGCFCLFVRGADASKFDAPDGIVTCSVLPGRSSTDTCAVIGLVDGCLQEGVH